MNKLGHVLKFLLINEAHNTAENIKSAFGTRGNSSWRQASAFRAEDVVFDC
jgi:hypothetical protein